MYTSFETDDLTRRACAAYFRRTGQQPCSASSYFDEARHRVILMNSNGCLGEYAVSKSGSLRFIAQ